MYKKVYVEITNVCNLNCSFCVKNNRKKEYISIDCFKILLNKLKGYTNYLYFHVMGEPLLHPNINELIDLASNDYKVNITTNGTMLDKIIDNKNIRQINISLHSIKDNLEKNLINIFRKAEKLLNNGTIVNYRLWVNEEKKNKIIEFINKYYNVDINELSNHTIKNNLFFSIEKEFIWPNMNNKDLFNGTCKALTDHIGILVDGTVVPCCLDSEGVIKLGNIYKNDLDEIINSKQYQELKKGFKENIRLNPLCKTCNFYNNKVMKQ